MRKRAEVFRRLFSGSGEVQVGQVGGEAVRQPMTGMLPEVPVPRRMSSVGLTGLKEEDGERCVVML